jgi:hypothetical protein
MLRVLAAIKADANRQPLYNFDKIAGRIFRRKQTRQRSRSAWKVFNGPFVIAPDCIYMDAYGLVRPHEFELGLFEVCRNPDVIEWNNGKQGLSRLDALADFDRFAANDSADRSVDFRICLRPGWTRDGLSSTQTPEETVWLQIKISLTLKETKWS